MWRVSVCLVVGLDLYFFRRLDLSFENIPFKHISLKHLTPLLSQTHPNPPPSSPRIEETMRLADIGMRSSRLRYTTCAHKVWCALVPCMLVRRSA